MHADSVHSNVVIAMTGGGGWNYYYPFSSTEEKTKWRIPAHADAELFTLLFQQEGEHLLLCASAMRA